MSSRIETAVDSLTVVFIPFVLQGENTTNAVLAIKFNNIDTTYKLIYANRYRDYGFIQTSNAAWNALNVFHLFTRFDKAIFGHTKFVISDKRILNQNDEVPSDSTPVVLEITTIPDSILARSESVYFCNTYMQCGQCAFREATDLTVEARCCNPTYHTTCTTVMIIVPDNDGGYGGAFCSYCPNDGGGGGGGGGGPDPNNPPSGGWYDEPACNPNNGATTVICDNNGGWHPIIENEGAFGWNVDFSEITNPKNSLQEPLIESNIELTNLVNPSSLTQGFPPRVIARTLPRNNTEDMTFGTNGDPSGIIYRLGGPSNYNLYTDQVLFDDMISLFHTCTFFDPDLENVGDIFINKFRNHQVPVTQQNLPLQHTTLNQKVGSSNRFRNFLLQFGNALRDSLIASGGSIDNVNFRDLNYRPVFNTLYDKFHGLQILLNDTESAEIELRDFTIDLVTGKWTADVRVIIRDHFGLDKNDAVRFQDYSNGFPAWWLLQHVRGYIPFETIVELNFRLSYQ